MAANRRFATHLGRLGTETAYAVSDEARTLAATGKKIYPFHIGDLNFATPEVFKKGAYCIDNIIIMIVCVLVLQEPMTVSFSVPILCTYISKLFENYAQITLMPECWYRAVIAPF